MDVRGFCLGRVFCGRDFYWGRGMPKSLPFLGEKFDLLAKLNVKFEKLRKVFFVPLQPITEKL